MPARMRRAALLLLCAALVCSLTGCRQAPKQAQSTIFAMDTVMDLQIYGGDQSSCQSALSACVEEIYALDRQLSAENPDSFVYALNHAGGEWVEAGTSGLGPLALLRESAGLCAATEGALDITAYPATQAWGFISGDYRVPGEAELAGLAQRIDYTQISISRGPGRVQLPQGMELDLGAVAKGYAADRLRDILAEAGGVDSALLDLGQSTIAAVGGKADGSPWRIGIRDPDGESYLGVLTLKDQVVSTSGGYQRYFDEDGVRYWHILDPRTAAPARSGLSSVTVAGENGLVCDGLSTALFVMGLEEGTQFWRDRGDHGLDFDVIFISGDGSVAVTAGLENSFTLAQGYEDREVTILR